MSFAPMDDGPLLATLADGIAVLTLNRPDRHNALSPELICRLADSFEAIERDPDVRVVILTGAGERSFCSGGDLSLSLPLLSGARAPETEWDHRLLADPGLTDRAALRSRPLSCPVIAAINGHCLAGGAETALSTDIRLMAEGASFALPEVKRGLIPFAGALARLPRHIPHAIAMELLMTGDPITAAEAWRVGLVNRVLPQAELMPAAMDMGRRIAANGPLALREVKRVVTEASGRPLADGFALEDAARDKVLASEDAREGPRAFIEKRRPHYRGR